jgi:hypothetical protein
MTKAADTRITRTFRRELALGLFAIVALAALVTWSFFHPEQKAALRWLLPAIPGLMAFGVLALAHRRMDEMERRIHLEAIAFGFGSSLVVCSVYGAMQLWHDWPSLNWALAGAVMTSLWALGLVLKARQYR